MSNESAHDFFAAERGPRTGVAIGLLAIITAASLLPFASKAFNFDDPIFLWPAREILAGSPNPLAAEINWYGTAEPLAGVTKNPWLVSFYIAAVVKFAGWSEAALHAAFILPAIGAVLGTFALARQLRVHATAAALLALFCPAMLVSATSVMSDVPMLCFWVWAVVAWQWADGRDRPLGFLIAGVLIAVAAMCKYPAISLIPLLAVAGMRRRRMAYRIGGLLLPLALLVLADYISRRAYGQGMVLAAMSYAAESTGAIASLPARLFGGLSYMGGCFPAIGLIAVITLPPRQRIVWCVMAACIATGLWFAPQWLYSLAPLPQPREWVVPQAAIFAALGIAIFWMLIRSTQRNRDRTALLLGLWILGVFTFATLVNWTTNARSFLPMAPALAVLAMRSMPADSPRFSWRWIAPLLAGAAVSFALAAADTSLANAQRSAAAQISTRARAYTGTLWFAGHWGFQWYMESAGGKAFDYDRSTLRTGDLIVAPHHNTNVHTFPRGTLKVVDRIAIPVNAGISTMNPHLGAHFYISDVGPLPWCFGPVPPEQFDMAQATQDVPPPKQPGP